MIEVFSKIHELPKGIEVQVILARIPINKADDHRVVIKTNGMGGFFNVWYFGYDVNNEVVVCDQVLAKASKFYEEATREFCMEWYMEKLMERIADLNSLSQETFKRVRWEG